MKKVFIIVSFSICLIFGLNQIGWCGNELTREMVKEMIIKAVGFPLDGEDTIRCEGNVWLEQASISLAKQGLVTLKKYHGGSVIFWGFSGLTPKGAQYLIKKEGTNYIVRTCKIKFGEVTGIINVMPAANVDFTIIVDELTPFASHFHVEAGYVEMKAIFILYDDGWLIVENSVKKK